MSGAPAAGAVRAEGAGASIALGMYDAALVGAAPLAVRDASGVFAPLDTPRWTAPADVTDERVLARAAGPVLDVGCGPGRHVRALMRRDVPVLGVEVARGAVGLARDSGAPVHHGSVFTPVPGTGSYRTALLLDGNVGIGGDPVALLARVGELLGDRGRVLCETGAPGDGVRIARVRLEDGAIVSEWFAWARVAADALAPLALAAGFALLATWHDGGRWFAELAKHPDSERRAA
jgi:SAM-dependent methyltransferase